MSVLIQPAVPQLPLFKAEPEDENVRRFMALLRMHGRLTRAQVCECTGACDRDVRAWEMSADSSCRLVRRLVRRSSQSEGGSSQSEGGSSQGATADRWKLDVRRSTF
jgi:hypothetical protein